MLPALVIVIDLGASIVYAADGDWRRAVYWIAAAVLTSSVTFLPPEKETPHER
jgi:type IV secretory pathway VirB2 component (pilin)